MSTIGRDIDRYARDRLAAEALRIVDVDGVPTRVYEAGDGEPLLLIHGGDFGSLYSLDCFSLVVEELARDYRVIAFDKLAQGHTGFPDGGSYTWEALYAHACALVAELDLTGAHLVGHSMGALLAARLALDVPERFATTTLVDSNTIAPDDPAYPWNRFYVELRQQARDTDALETKVRREPTAQAHDPRWVTDDFVRRMSEIAELPVVAAASRALAECRATTWMPSLQPVRRRTIVELEERGLAMPALVLWGYEDRSAPPALAWSLFQRLCAGTTDARLHVLHGAAHYCFRDRPTAFVAAVRAFCG